MQRRGQECIKHQILIHMPRRSEVMDNTLYIGLAAQSALKRQMDVLAHNVANVNTTAYNKENVLFKEYLMDIGGNSVSSGGKISTVLDVGTIRDLEEGAFTRTGNPLDFAISGRAYLSVENAAGDQFYTRNGRMTISENSELITLSGNLVLDNANNPIIINPEDTGFEITEKGMISSENRQIAQLGIYRFENERSMKRSGDSLYSSEQPAIEATEFKIVQGSVENSNVNAVMAMTEMIDISRKYESLSRSMGKLQELRKDSLNRLAKVQ